mgnify:CR=1 FL=1
MIRNDQQMIRNDQQMIRNDQQMIRNDHRDAGEACSDTRPPFVNYFYENLVTWPAATLCSFVLPKAGAPSGQCGLKPTIYVICKALEGDFGLLFTKNYLLPIPLLGTENSHVVDLAQPSKDVSLHLKEYSLYRMFQIQDLHQLSILAK